MSFRKDASKIVKSTNSLIRGRLIKEPKWLKAAIKYPNNNNYIRTNTNFNIEAPLPFEQNNNNNNKQIKEVYSSGLPLNGKANNQKLKFISLKPKPIVYPEDQLRKQFFEDHPFELIRAKSLVEDGEIDQNWSKLLMKDKTKRIEAEDVIKFQLYLHNQGFTRLEAYEIATKELAKHRIAEEYEEEYSLNEAKRLGVKLNKDVVQHGLEKEEEMLELSRKQIQLTDALRKSQEFTAEKTFKDNQEIVNPNL